MDKEQIIIDGVFINACLVSEKCKEFETCKIKNILRQLARKTQECEKWKSYYKLYRLDEELLKKIQAVVNSHPKYGVELTDTGVIEKDERLCTLEVPEQIKLIFDETLKENEELKKQVVRCSEGWGKADCEKNWYQQAEQAKQEENHDLTMKLYEYRKTLEEIEEVINGYMNKNELYNRRLNKIFDIISKAKGEENEKQIKSVQY